MFFILAPWRTDYCCFTRCWIITKSHRISEPTSRQSSMDSRYNSQPIESLLMHNCITSLFLGPDIPGEYLSNGRQLVSNGETLFFVHTSRNIFLKLQCDTLEDCHWVSMEQRLQHTRDGAVVVLIPDHLTNCTYTFWKLKNTYYSGK